MESRAYALLTGLFTILLGAALGLAIWWFTGDKKAYDQYLLVSKHSVSGLNPQGSVRYRGIDAGKVLSLALDPANPQNTLIHIKLDRNIKPTKGTVGQLGYQGVTGIAYVLLEDEGNNPEPLEKPEKGLPRIPMKPSLFETLSKSAEVILGQGGELIKRATNLLSERNQKQFMEAFADLSAASKEHDAAMEEFKQTAEKIKQLLNDENQQKLAEMISNFSQASEEIKPLAVEYKKLALNMQSLAKKLDKISDETGGELAVAAPKINELLNQLTENSRNLNKLLEDLQRAPQSILFGKAPPKPGPGEKGFNTEGGEGAKK